MWKGLQGYRRIVRTYHIIPVNASSESLDNADENGDLGMLVTGAWLTCSHQSGSLKPAVRTDPLGGSVGPLQGIL